MHPRLTAPIGLPDLDRRGLPVRRSKRSYDSQFAHTAGRARIASVARCEVFTDPPSNLHAMLLIEEANHELGQTLRRPETTKNRMIKE